MQPSSRLSGVCLAVVAAGFLAAPIVAAEETSPSSAASFVDPDSAEARSYRTAGEYAIDRLVMTMITDCSAAVARQTEVAALPTFHLKDVPMKNGTVAGLPRIAAFKLTSLKLRNPANAPDAAEQQALKRIRIALDVGNPPRIVVQKIEQAGAPAEWRVYKPLANIRQCGTCHGDPAEMSPELRSALQKKYPDDQAVGYSVGEWRGVIRVTVAEPAAAATKPTTGKK